MQAAMQSRWRHYYKRLEKKKSYLGWGIFHGKGRWAAEASPWRVVEHQVNPCCTAGHPPLSLMPTGCVWGCCTFVSDELARPLDTPQLRAWSCHQTAIIILNFIRSLSVILYERENAHSNNKISFKALPGNLSMSKPLFTCPQNPYPRISDPSITRFFSLQEVFSRKRTVWSNQGNQASLSAGVILK